MHPKSPPTSPVLPPVPFHVRMVLISRNEDDSATHKVKFNVVGVPSPASVTITSGMYTNPVITARHGRGGLDLPDRLMDALAIKCFSVVAGFIIDQDGQSGSWTAKDITKWLRRQFMPADADQIIRELSRHVTPGIDVQNMSVVSDDDNV